MATPGRLLQHMDETPGFDAGSLQLLVLDEADRILDLVRASQQFRFYCEILDMTQIGAIWLTSLRRADLPCTALSRNAGTVMNT